MFNLIIGATIGGAIGTSIRYIVTYKVSAIWPGYPYATLFVNTVGCFAMGCIAAWLIAKNYQVGFWQAFIAVGVLGGLTTFSTFALDWWTLARKDGYFWANGYAAITLIFALTAFWFGEAVAKRYFI